ncbi:MAG: thiol-disulfide oxidoreductase DCC family protein [Phycisphaerales bacterium]
MKRDVCYYDGDCGLCQGTVRVLRGLDWLGRLEFRDMLAEADLPVALEEAMRGMPMRTREGRVLVGYPAVRRALAQTPVGLLPGLLMYVPGLAWIGSRVYGEIARRRGRRCRVRADRSAA